MSLETGEVKQETGLVTMGEQTALSQETMKGFQEKWAAMTLAKKFPRNYDRIWQATMKACQRKSLAEKAHYSLPRGGATITGKSVHLARQIAAIYDNLHWETTIVKEVEDGVVIAVTVWDPETNHSVRAEDLVRRLIQKKTEKGTIWVTADEGRMREVINRRAAFLLRNCLFAILPPDLVEDASRVCLKTLKDDIKDPSAEKKRLLYEFGKLDVTVDMLNTYLGHETWNADDIVELQGVLIALTEGGARLSDYFGAKKEEPAQGGLDVSKMQAGKTEEHQGHEPAQKSTGTKTPF